MPDDARIRRFSFQPIITELLLWYLVAIIVSGQFWLDVLQYGQQVRVAEIITRRYVALLLGITALVFPLFFRLIFDYYPIQLVRLLLRRGAEADSPRAPIERPAPTERELPREVPLGNSAPDQLLAALARSSDRLAERLYVRSGIYLLVGALIAFTGLIFFYLQTAPLREVRDTITLLFSLAPRFGVLFFIELIAFFFLKQYRAAMDEFRYFEAIKRNREDNLTIVVLASHEWKTIDVHKLLEACKFNAQIGRLGAGESTEIIESRKLTKDEMAIFEKIVDVVGSQKTTKTGA